MNYRGEPLPMQVAKLLCWSILRPPRCRGSFLSLHERLDPALDTARRQAHRSIHVPRIQVVSNSSAAISAAFDRTTDPYTPYTVMRGDRYGIRLLVGAHVMHDYTMHRVSWLCIRSQFRQSRDSFIILSRHYELLFDLPDRCQSVDGNYLQQRRRLLRRPGNGAEGLRSWNPEAPRTLEAVEQRRRRQRNPRSRPRLV
jgi:hypothetical protein